VFYGLYLWHWPVHVVVTEERTGLEGVALLAVRVVVTGAVAAASFRWVEEPIRARHLQRRFTVSQWRRAVAVATATVVAATLGATASASSPGLAPPTAESAVRAEPAQDAEGRIVEAFLLGDSQSYGLRQYYGNRIDGLAVTGSTELGCHTLLPERYVDGQIRPKDPSCVAWEGRWTQEVAATQPDLVVLMLGLGELYDRRVAGGPVPFGTPEYRDWLYDEIDRRRDLVRAHSAGLH